MTRDNDLRTTLLPSLALLLAVLVGAAPWGLPGNATFILPLLTMAVVFIFSVPPSPMLPPWLVFAAGLASDVLTAGPLGYWAFIFLLAHCLARAFAARPRALRLFGQWLAFALTAALVAAVGWGLASLYFVRLIDWHPMAVGAGVVTLAFPVLALVLRPLVATAGAAGRRGLDAVR